MFLYLVCPSVDVDVDGVRRPVHVADAAGN